MASTISTLTGKPPWYGVVGNGLKSIQNTYKKINFNDDNKDCGIDRFFVYSKGIVINGASYTWVLNSGRLNIYTDSKNKMFAYTQPIYTDETSSSDIYSSYTDYDSLVAQIDIDYFSCNYTNDEIYVKDTDDFFILRQENSDGVGELIITYDGYIQFHTSENRPSSIILSVKQKCSIIPDIYSSCNDCYYKKYNNCSKANDSRTTCYFNLEDWKRNRTTIAENKNYVLLKPDTVSDSGWYTASTTEYISNTGLIELAGELYIAGTKIYNGADYDPDGYEQNPTYISKKIIRTIPLAPTTLKNQPTNSLYVDVKTESNTGRIFLKPESSFSINNDNELLKSGQLNIKYNDEIYRNSYSHTKNYNYESIYYPYEIGYNSTRIYTQGTSTSSSSYACWNNVSTCAFSTRKRIKTLTVGFKYNYITTKGMTTKPNKNVPGIRFYYNTGTSNLDTLSTANCNYVDFTLSDPYYYEIIKTFTINDYVKQFALVPIETRNTIASTDRMSLFVDWISWTDYNTSDKSHTYDY